MNRAWTIVRIEIDLDAQWGIGGVASLRDEIDLPVQIDPVKDRPHLPLSSVAGSLRAQLGDLAETWLGPASVDLEAAVKNLESGRPTSALWLVGAVLEPGGHVAPRGQTAVDARRGAAKGGSLRQRQEVVSRGHQLVVVVAVHDGAPDAELLDRLAGWPVVLGRGRTTGSGRGTVRTVTAHHLDGCDPERLTWWLTERHTLFAGGAAVPPWLAAIERAGTYEWPDPVLSLPWTIEEPLRIGTGASYTNQHGREVAALLRHDGVPVVPGSSWKGLFRARSDVILRALGVEDDDRDVIIDRVFGSTARRGALQFQSSPVREALTRERTHVAIDRISGGSRDKLLFTAEVLVTGELTLQVDCESELADVIVPLLCWVARDLHDGLIGLGGGVTRGYGSLRLCPAAEAELSQRLGRGAAWLEGLRERTSVARGGSTGAGATAGTEAGRGVAS